jgi:hypothetical protein
MLLVRGPGQLKEDGQLHIWINYNFSLLDHQDAFSFVDPGQVIRACHLIPKFVLGKCHINGEGLSRCANDGEAWQMYYANRYAAIVVFLDNEL